METLTVSSDGDIFLKCTLTHRKVLPQTIPVRRMVLYSFLEQMSYHSDVASEEFVLGPLLKALNDPENHKDFGSIISVALFPLNHWFNVTNP